MPHTPLLRRLVALAHVVDRSDRTGVPVDALLLDRRTFLAGTAAAVGLAACSDAPTAGPRAPAAPRADRAGGIPPTVAVVGAGLAGLTCALRLRQGGIVADVFEASERLGGRCWTRRDATFLDGQLTEHGGELIDQSHTAIRQLAQELGLALDNVVAAEPSGTEALFHFDGAPYSPREAARDLKAVWQPLKRDYVEAGYPTLYTRSTPRGRALDATSIAQWIEQTVPGGRASRLGQLLETAYVIEYGAEATEQSALNLIYLLGAVGQGQLRVFGPSNEKYKVRGGNDLLVQRMAALLPAVQRGRRLTGISRALGGSWALSFAGESVPRIYERVVLAIPFSVLRGVSRDGAGFPAVKERAITELGMGANAKLAVQFETRRWHALGCNGDTTSDRGYQQTWEATRAQPGRRGILVDYTGGEAATRQSGRPTQLLAEQFLAQIAPVLSGLVPSRDRTTVRAAFDDWPANPYTLGSYAFWKVGQYTAFAGAEGEAVDGCHFAGEHTSVDAQGYLEGAVESGARAATEVLTGLRRAGLSGVRLAPALLVATAMATVQLTPCAPGARNCVSTESAVPRQAMPAVPFADAPTAAQARARAALLAEPRTTIVRETPGYLRAEARSRILGFVDDVELVVDPAARVFRFRSASRVGRGDLGVNRKRMERVSARLRAR